MMPGTYCVKYEGEIVRASCLGCRVTDLQD
jgi:hypothetical protein